MTEFLIPILSTLLAISHTLGFVSFRLIILKKYPELDEWKAQLFMYFTWPFIVIIAYKNYKR
jgi:hypothetical protein